MNNRVTNEEGRKLIKAKILEASVQKVIADYLNARRIPHSVTNAEESYDRNGNRRKRVETGWPDITGCHPATGKLLAIECKRGAGGRLSTGQAVYLDWLWQSGALVVVARSLDEVIEALRTGKTSAETRAEIVRSLPKGKRLPVKKSRP